MTLQRSWFWSVPCTLLLLCIVHQAMAKKSSGDFRLSGENSNYLLGSFAVSTEGGKLDLALQAEHMYTNEKALHVRLYRDTEWGSAYRKVQLCSEKIQFAKQSFAVEFQFVDKKWQATITAEIPNLPEGRESPRPHYWYFVLDDCSLELYFQDNQVPKMHYDLNVWNYLPNKNNKFSSEAKVTHLSADERHLTQLHVLTLLLSGIVAFFLVMNILLTIATTKKSIHLALMWVAVAAALDASSSLFELIHLKLYDMNGVGSYSIDALSAHLEAVCDASLVVLLWAIAAGWTLPSDVVAVNASATPIQKLLEGMSKPVGSLLQFNAAALLSISILMAHVILAQWGRIYNDDFESYHDLEHLPGKILMGMRIIAGLLFLIATIQTRAQCQIKQLRAFYSKLAVAGFCWFQSLPILTFLCSRFIPYHLRHPAVFIGSALAQSGSLVFLAMLVTSHTSVYQEYSHMTTTDQSLTDQLTDQPRTWNLGKAKVRLD